MKMGQKQLTQFQSKNKSTTLFFITRQSDALDMLILWPYHLLSNVPAKNRYKNKRCKPEKSKIYYSVYKQKGKVRLKICGCCLIFVFHFVFFLFKFSLASITGSSPKLGLELLLILESRVGLFDKTGFGLEHLLLHPRSDCHNVRINSRLLLIAAPHRPRRQAD